MKLRILQVVPTYFPAVRYGGPIRSVHGLSAALVRRGHDVQVYTTTLDGGEDLQVPLDAPTKIDGVEVHYHSVPTLRRLAWSPTMRERLEKNIAGFDVVHLHATFLWPTWAAARIARRAGIPYLLSPRGMLGPAVVRGKSRLLKTLWIRLIERRSLAESAGLHVTAPLEAEEVSVLGLTVPRVFCVPNGLEWPEERSPLSEGPFADLPRPYALFLSRIDWKKGLDRLITAWKWVPDLPLIIAGNDEHGYLATLHELVKREGMTDRIRFIGPASDRHKWALYENAAMLVLPSYSENFGNVVAEAMAMACPVVVTPEVGLASFVQETGAGVVTPGEPRQLASAIAALHADPTVRRQMGAAGKRAVTERLSWNAIAGQMEQAYLEAAGAHETPLRV